MGFEIIKNIDENIITTNNTVVNGGNMENIVQIMMIIVPILMGLIMIFAFFMIFSSKFRGNMMSKQIKSMKHMVDFSKEDLEDVLTSIGNISVNAQNNIVTQNKDVLKETVDVTADIHKDAITTTVKAIKDGMTSQSEPTMFCKHCGVIIDADSRFCKNCGKEQ